MCLYGIRELGSAASEYLMTGVTLHSDQEGDDGGRPPHVRLLGVSATVSVRPDLGQRHCVATDRPDLAPPASPLSPLSTHHQHTPISISIVRKLTHKRVS